MFDPSFGERHRLGPPALAEMASLFECLQGFKAEAFPRPVDSQMTVQPLFPGSQVEQQQRETLNDLILHIRLPLHLPVAQPAVAAIS
jgi:hypothetical protein